MNVPSKLLILGLGICWMAGPLLGQEFDTQRIAELNLYFSHSRHLKALDLECTFCHSRATESSQSTDSLLPSKETCAICHEVQESSRCLTCHPMPESAHALVIEQHPVQFNHELHAAIPDLPSTLKQALDDGTYPESGFIELAALIRPERNCTGCHRGMENAEFGGPQNYPRMSDCMVCHQTDSDPMKDCVTCHPDEPYRRPVSHMTETFFDDHSAEEGSHDSQWCRQCHMPRFNPCMQCH
ncbi:MAG: cytochrome c3 family protein [Acidobacteriota bacterium]|nr:MAG: cytochrome c3 family protein [Acidobacteriota bacterium]